MVEKRKEGSIVTHALPPSLLNFFHSHFLQAPTFKHGFDQRKGENYFLSMGAKNLIFSLKNFSKK